MTSTMDDVTSAVTAYTTEQVRVATQAATEPLLAQIALLRQINQRPLPTGWSKVDYLEDFTGDLSGWNVRNATTQNNTFCNNFARNVTLRDGMLVLTGRRETTTVQTNSGPRTCDYSSGYIDSTGANQLKMTIGSRLEIWANLPTIPGFTSGIWPAGWVRHETGAGEFDLVEAWGEPTGGTNATSARPEIYRPGSFSSSCYANTDDPAAGKLSNWGTPVGAPPVAGAIHCYALEWDSVGLRAYFDKNPAHVNARYDTVPWLEKAFPRSGKMNVRLNLQIGQKYWGMPTSLTKFPVEFIVDAVRLLRP